MEQSSYMLLKSSLEEWKGADEDDEKILQSEEVY
jgi:hypothetical protein